MELNVCYMILAFSLVCLYVGFSKNHEIRGAVLAWSVMAGTGFIILGFGIYNQITYIFGDGLNVNPYTLEGGGTYSVGHFATGLMFAFFGLVIIILGVLRELFGEQSFMGDESKLTMVK